jgi:hypothetical protein
VGLTFVLWPIELPRRPKTQNCDLSTLELKREMEAENLSGSHYSDYTAHRKWLLSLIKELRQFGYVIIAL